MNSIVIIRLLVVLISLWVGYGMNKKDTALFMCLGNLIYQLLNDFLT